MKIPNLQKITNGYHWLNEIVEDVVPYVDTIDELEEALETAISEYEVTYFANAIKILSEEDQSLEESLELAEECGYSMSDINSELLATLLVQSRMREELSDFLEEVKAN